MKCPACERPGLRKVNVLAEEDQKEFSTLLEQGSQFVRGLGEYPGGRTPVPLWVEHSCCVVMRSRFAMENAMDRLGGELGVDRKKLEGPIGGGDTPGTLEVDEDGDVSFHVRRDAAIGDEDALPERVISCIPEGPFKANCPDCSAACEIGIEDGKYFCPSCMTRFAVAPAPK